MLTTKKNIGIFCEEVNRKMIGTPPQVEVGINRTGKEVQCYKVTISFQSLG